MNHNDRSPAPMLPADDPLARRAQALCQAHGLALRGVRRQGVLLELLPLTLETLPDAALLREIADALAGDGIRYVALSLDEPSA